MSNTSTIALRKERTLRRIERDVTSRVLRVARQAMRNTEGQLQQEVVTNLLAGAMAFAHMAGRDDALRLEVARRLPQAADRVETASEFLAKRLGLRPIDAKRLREKYGPIAANALRGLDGERQRVIDDAVREAVGAGRTLRDTQKMVRESLSQSGFAPERPHTIETVFRSQSAIAYSAGDAQVDLSPGIDEILWGYTYHTVGDDRVRPEHAALDGVTLPKDDPQWRRIKPPNGYNCRCVTTRVFADESPDIVPVRERTVRLNDGTEQRVIGRADKGWDFNPGDLGTDIGIQPNAASIDTRVLHALSLSGGRTTISAVARRIGAPYETVRSATHRLIERGMIDSEPQRHGVSITNSGTASLVTHLIGRCSCGACTSV